jgi:hypothetical protein
VAIDHFEMTTTKLTTSPKQRMLVSRKRRLGMKDHYPSEKFYNAVDTLATSSRPLQQRIADAFSHSLHLLLVHSDALPGDTKQKLIEYEAAWNAVDDAGEQGTINVWARRLSDDEAMEVASWIVEQAFELHRQFWTDED